MNLEDYRNYCLSLKGAEEGFPFDATTIVFTIKGKMFSLSDIDKFEFINVKCDPEIIIDLRERYEGVIPGYHMNKNHWNSILTNSRIPDKLIKEWIKNSYNLIVKGLPKKLQKELAEE